jgi:hypothetical protein
VAKDPQYSEVAATNAAFNRHQADILRQGQSSSFVLGDDGPLATVSDIGSQVLNIKLPILGGNSINDTRRSADAISSYGTSFINWFSTQYNSTRDSIDRSLAGSNFQGYSIPYLYSADFVVAGVTTIGRTGVGIPSAFAHPIDSAKGVLVGFAGGIDAALVAENTSAITHAQNAAAYLSSASGREIATGAGNLTGNVALTVSPLKLARAGRYSPTNTLVIRPHKNSPAYVGDTHVYVIRGPDGSIHKFGQSAQGVSRDGTSIRAELQARKLQRELGGSYTTDIIRSFDGKANALASEQRFIQTYKRVFGKLPPGNPFGR